MKDYQGRIAGRGIFAGSVLTNFGLIFEDPSLTKIGLSLTLGLSLIYFPRLTAGFGRMIEGVSHDLGRSRREGELKARQEAMNNTHLKYFYDSSSLLISPWKRQAIQDDYRSTLNSI